MNKREKSQTETRETQRIEAEIGQTRSAISQDLKAIGEKLSPENLKQEARHKADQLKQEAKETVMETVMEVKDAAVGKMRETKERAVERVRDVRDSALESATHAGQVTASFVRDNAVPLSLIGIGIGWMIASNRRRRSREEWMPPRRERDFGERDFGERDFGERDFGERDFEDGEPGRIRAKAGEVMERMQERGHELKQRAGHGLGVGRERVRDFGHRAQEGLHRAEVRSRQFAHDNPLALGVAALAAGVGVGLLLPSTAKEDELLGGTRDRLIDEAREGVEELGRGLKQTGKEVSSALREHTQPR